MLIDKPGIKYLLHEAQLQQIGVGQRIKKAQQEGKSVAGAVLGQLGNTLVGTAKILGSTLAQVPVNGTGLHFLKGFRTDTYLQPTNGNQASGFAQFFGAGGVEGAPLALQGKPIEGKVVSNFGTVDPRDISKFTVTRNSDYDYNDFYNSPIPEGSEGHKALAESGKPITIPGPQYETTAQPYELGRSNQIKEADQGELLPNNGNDGNQLYTADDTYTGVSPKDAIAAATSGKKIIAHKNPAQYEYFSAVQQDFSTAGGRAGDGISTKGEESIPKPVKLAELQVRINTGSETTVSEDINVNTTIQDFRQGSTTQYSFDYNNIKIKRETRVNLGDQGRKKVEGFYTSYSNIDSEAIDKLNALDIQDNERAAGNDKGRDLAKFYFEIITPEGSKFLHFRAFIDSIDDNYNADWQGNKYVGRADNFYTYGGFERDINISFKIAAATRSEMKPLYRKMVLLASSTAPTYGGQGFMRGTLARITVGSYFSQIPGVLTSVKFSLIDGMPWEIAMQNPEAGTDDDVQELPMGLQCNISFKAIHDFTPQTGLKHYFTNPKPVNGSKPFF